MATVHGTGATSDAATTPRCRWRRAFAAIEKDGTVPGGTADVVGEAVSYTMA